MATTCKPYHSLRICCPVVQCLSGKWTSRSTQVENERNQRAAAFAEIRPPAGMTMKAIVGFGFVVWGLEGSIVQKALRGHTREMFSYTGSNQMCFVLKGAQRMKRVS